MEVEFANKELERLLYEEGLRSSYPTEVITAYRKRMQFILQSPDERAFRAMKSFHFEELKGTRAGQHSIRLNKQYRIVFRMEGEREQKKIVLLAIEDYH